MRPFSYSTDNSRRTGLFSVNRCGFNVVICAPRLVCVIRSERTTIFRERMAVPQEKTSIRHEGMTILHEQTSIVWERMTILQENTSISLEGMTIRQEKMSILREGMAIVWERMALGRQHSWPDWQRMARDWMTDGELTRDSEGGRERTQGTQRRSENVSRRFSLGDHLGPGLGRCPGLS